MLPLHLLALVSAFVLTSVVMPSVIELAKKHRLLDYPDGERRNHPYPVPRIGGVALFGAATIAAVATFAIDRALGTPDLVFAPVLPGLVIGLAIVFTTGIVDDLRGLGPVLKFAAQTLAALALVSYGFRIDTITITGAESWSLGVFALPITVLWLVGITNAFNLIDGVDGLAGSFAVLALTVAGIVELYNHSSSVLVITLAILGAVVAFLRFNIHPARVFLGDAGSMTLGFFLAVRLVQSATVDAGNGTSISTVRVLTPLLALAYPIIDTMIAIARRWIRGQPLSRADGRHIHHQIQALGISPARTVELLLVVFGSLAAVGIVIDLSPPVVTLTVGLLTLAAMLLSAVYAVRWLRYTEFTEFGLSVLRVLLNARRHVGRKVVANELAKRIETATTLEELAALLNDTAEELHLVEVNLIPGSHHFRGPSAQLISPPSQIPLRVDYPISALGADGQRHEVILRLWCARPVGHQYLGAERVATMLGPAVERWLAQNAHAVAPATAPTKTSGAHRLHPQ
jgi:UDP-GlcNAc:undecaprenyl-phosphate GlcNAc-1-phosphate transferase